ncbi:hypothetical protein KC976_04680, partial [Candidatus Saccharibacteria bacterium]|nr:hypothetical protein [Candidatus Saccharibacteria bacterium]
LPMVTMESLVGDCDDFALFIAAACHSIGLPYRFVFVGSNWEARRGEDVLADPEHVYLEIGTPPLVDISEATGKMGVSIPYCKADASDPNGSFCDRVRMGQTSKHSGGWLTSLGVIGALLLILLLVKGR